MNEAQFQEFMFWQRNNADETRQFIDEQVARLTNVLKPGTYDECACCGKVVTQPCRNFEEHGDDFCSEDCFQRYVEHTQFERCGEAHKIADKKMEKFPKWEEIYLNFDEAGGNPPTVAGVAIVGLDVEIIGDEEQYGGCEDADGEYCKYYYNTVDGNHLCECRCLSCNNEFTIKAQTLFASRRNPCPECKKVKNDRP